MDNSSLYEYSVPPKNQTFQKTMMIMLKTFRYLNVAAFVLFFILVVSVISVVFGVSFDFVPPYFISTIKSNTSCKNSNNDTTTMQNRYPHLDSSIPNNTPHPFMTIVSSALPIK